SPCLIKGRTTRVRCAVFLEGCASRGRGTTLRIRPVALSRRPKAAKRSAFYSTTTHEATCVTKTQRTINRERPGVKDIQPTKYKSHACLRTRGSCIEARRLERLRVRRCLSLGDLGHDLLRHVARYRLVVRELHGVGGTAARHAAQMSDVSEHFRERDDGDHGDVGAALQLILDHAAPAVDVADDIAEIIAGGHSLDLHHRLEQYRARLADAFAEG